MGPTPRAGRQVRARNGPQPAAKVAQIVAAAKAATIGAAAKAATIVAAAKAAPPLEAASAPPLVPAGKASSSSGLPVPAKPFPKGSVARFLSRAPPKGVPAPKAGPVPSQGPVLAEANPCPGPTRGFVMAPGELQDRSSSIELPNESSESERGSSSGRGSQWLCLSTAFETLDQMRAAAQSPRGRRWRELDPNFDGSTEIYSSDSPDVEVYASDSPEEPPTLSHPEGPPQVFCPEGLPLAATAAAPPAATASAPPAATAAAPPATRGLPPAAKAPDRPEGPLPASMTGLDRRAPKSLGQSIKVIPEDDTRKHYTMHEEIEILRSLDEETQVSK